MKLCIDEFNDLQSILGDFCNDYCKFSTINSLVLNPRCASCPFHDLEKLIDAVIDRRAKTASGVPSEGMVVITVDGDIRVKKCEEITLDELQKVVDGYIETVPVTIGNGRYIMVVNEEGKLRNLDYNLCATKIRNRYRTTEDVIVGNVAIVKQKGEDLIGLSKADLLDFMNYDQLMEVLL